MATLAAKTPMPPPTGGVRVDLPVRGVDNTSLSAGENWLSRDGSFKVRPGLDKFGDNVTSRPTGIVQFRKVDGTLKVVMATVTGWRVFDGGSLTWTDISGTALTGAATDQNVFRVFEKSGVAYLVGTNGANTMKKWNGSAGTYSDVGGSPSRYRCIAISANRMIGCNILSGGNASPTAVDVSDDLNFESGWGSVQLETLQDTPGAIVAALEMGNLQTAIYKEDAIYMAIAQGTTDPFAFPLKETVEGPVSTLAAAAISDGAHVFLGRDGCLRVYDGMLSRSLGYSIQKYVLNTIDPSTKALSFITYDPDRNEVWLFYPEIGSSEPNLAAVVNLGTGALWPMRWATKRFSAATKMIVPTAPPIDSLTGTVDGMSKDVDQLGTEVRSLLIAGNDGQVYSDLGYDDDGDPIPAFFDSGVMDLGPNFSSLQEIDYLFPKAGQSQEIDVSIGTSDYGEDAVFGDPQTIDVGVDGPYITGHRVSTRGVALRMELDAVDRVEFLGARAGLVQRGMR